MQNVFLIRKIQQQVIIDGTVVAEIKAKRKK